MNELFPVAHPSMLEFVAVLEELSREKAEFIRDLRKGRVKRKKSREIFEIPEIASAFKAFNPKKKKRNV